MPTDRDTYKYHFKKGNKIVRADITSDIDRTESILRKRPGMSKGRIKQVGYRTTREAALAWLKEQGKKGKPIRKN